MALVLDPATVTLIPHPFPLDDFETDILAEFLVS
jgi:hypothetical protein